MSTKQVIFQLVGFGISFFGGAMIASSWDIIELPFDLHPAWRFVFGVMLVFAGFFIFESPKPVATEQEKE